MRLVLRRITAELVLAVLLAVSTWVVSMPQVALADVLYFYDDVGRLVQVVDQNGDSAQYVYDAAGNITQIVRIPAATLSITRFTPRSGPVGTAVTIYGSAFSTTPANNTVRFNGTVATVNSASANQLVATVPSGATSGPISVTVGAQSATSSDNFSVTTGSSGPPTITGFTPGGGAAGTAVTITGTNFDTTVANNTVRFNDADQAVLSSASATQLSAVVPNYAASGPIAVRTPSGTAVSTDDFIVPPAGYNYADIIARSRITIDGASGSLSIGTTNKRGVALFNAHAGDFLSLQLSTLSVSPSGSVAYAVFDPRNFQIASGSVSASAMSIHLPALASAGTYSVIFSPGAATASLTFTLTRNPVLSPAQTANLTISVAGQSVRTVFRGTAGTTANLRMGVASTSPANQTVAITLYKDARQVATANGSPSTDGAVIADAPIQIDGTYFVQLAPSNSATASLSVTLNPPMDLAIDGSSLATSTSTAGYQKRLLFSATAGQSIGVGLSALAYTPSNATGSTSMTVYKPDGTALATTSTSCNPSNPNGSCSTALAPVNVPTSGTYQLVVSPPAGAAVAGTLTLSNPFYSTLTNGSPVAISITRSGQHAAFNFTGTAGQAVTLRLATASTNPADQSVTLALWGPTGQVGSTISGTASSDGLTFYSASLPASGTYGVIVVPSYSSTGAMTLTLNPAMDFAIDAASLAVSTSTAGYQKRLLFSATVGQQIGLALTGLAYTPSSGVNTMMYLYNPSGGLVAATTCNPSNPGGGCGSGILNLPTAGTYQVVLAPPSNVTLSGTLTASNPIYGSLTAGTPLSLNMTRSGQFSNIGFSGTAGQSVMLRLAIASTTPTNQAVTLSLWGPTGQVGSSVTGTPSSDGMTLYAASLPATGSYAVTAVPAYGATGSMTLTLNPAADFTVDGAPVAVSTPAAGYSKRYLISAAANDVIDIGISSIVHSPASGAYTTFSVLAPNGSTAVSTSCSTGGLARCDVSFLASTAGLYTILLTPPSGVNFSGNMTISHRLTGTLTIGGGAIAVGLDRDGQKANLSFSGTSGQLLRLSVTGMSTNPSGQAVYFYIDRSDFSNLTWTSTTAATLNFDIPALDGTGTWYVIVVPVNGVQADMNVSLGTR